jgi:predicted nucleotide-binding protein
LDGARETLQNNGFQILSEERMNNGLGSRLKCADGEIVCVYDTGKVVVQGKNQAAVKPLFGQEAPAAPVEALKSLAANRNVFVVYGHDGPAEPSWRRCSAGGA